VTELLDAPPLAWERLVAAGEADERLVATGVDEPRAADSVPAPPGLSPALTAALRRAGIADLYSHQVEALEAASRADVIVTSGTASGKSLSFNLPVLDAICVDPKTRALYVYPTKALAQDQARKLSELGLAELRQAIYDGDTPREDRPAIRRRSNLVLTNPDMLNMAMLAHHKGWGDFLANLGFVVVDEAHTYRGVFGSHVANVLRRLRRVARLYGSEPRFLLASATIANPTELAAALTGSQFELVDSDGAPSARRRFAIWNPPVIDEKTMIRRSVLSEAAELLADLVVNGSRTICFLKSRRGIELIQRFTRMRLEELGEVRPDHVAHDLRHELDALARLDEADRPRAAPDERREDGGGLGERRRALAQRLVLQRRVPHRDLPRGARRAVAVDERHLVQAREPLGELDRVGDRRAGQQDPRLGPVGGGDPAQAAQDVGDVRAEHPAVHVRLVDDDDREVGEHVRPRLVVGEDPDVQHVGVGEDEVRAPADLRALRPRRVAVVDRRPHPPAQAELGDRARLVLGERLRRVQVQRARLRVPAQDVERRELEAQRLARRRARGDDRRSGPGGVQRLRLMRVQAVDPARGERAGHVGVQLLGQRDGLARPPVLGRLHHEPLVLAPRAQQLVPRLDVPHDGHHRRC